MFRSIKFEFHNYRGRDGGGVGWGWGWGWGLKIQVAFNYRFYGTFVSMMSTAKSHPIWNSFKKSEGGNRSSCNKFCTQITCPNSGTTNMIEHLKRKHLRLHKLYNEEKKKFDQSLPKLAEKPTRALPKNKLCFPKLAEVARIVFANPATAAPSERVWSDARNNVTDAR